MDHDELGRRFTALGTAHLADACIRTGNPVRAVGLTGVIAGSRLAGRVCPARHAGSVDVFLEAFESAAPGDVLVADNGGRLDEACVGDLVALEAHLAGLSGIVIWGLHRDTGDLRAIGLPVFSLGALPAGPPGARQRPPGALAGAQVGGLMVTREDLVLADDDGVLFIPTAGASGIFAVAETIKDTERRQASQIRAGAGLRAQLRFGDFLARRAADPSFTFRDHLRLAGGAIEE